MKLLVVILLLLASCTSVQPRHPAPAIDGLELPAFDASEDIVQHLGYTASYNHQTLLPDWVAWQLTAEKVSDAYDFQCSFSRDPDVEFPKASREDYSHSGWDKGHMAPRADMRWSEQALMESYYFTNICPQDHDMNSGAWRKMEELTRRLARHYGAVYVVCGPIVGTGRHGTIGKAGVQVPDAYFKALATSTSTGYAAVAFVVDNSRQDGSPRRYAVSVDSVEALVGRNLFPLLPEEVEATFDWNQWNY